jgi:anti-sigma factor RsiW
MSHERVVALLAAYTDDELPLEIRREVGAHLAECSRCVQELRVQSALRHPLGAEESAQEPSDALMRLEGYVAARATRVGATGVGRASRRSEAPGAGTRW